MMLFFEKVAAYGSIFHDKSIAWLMALKWFFGESREKNDESRKIADFATRPFELHSFFEIFLVL